MTNIEKEYYKVLDSTYAPTEIKNEMIGGVYECHTNYHHGKRIGLYTEDKSNWFIFNHSDVQKVFDPELKFNGEVIGKGDEVGFDEVDSERVSLIVEAAYMFGDAWVIVGRKQGEVDNTYSVLSFEIASHTPLFKKYIELNGKKYRKEVEEVLKEYEVK